MKVRIPSPLHSYTDRRGLVEAEGTTIAEALADLDRRHPGIRFRVIDEQDRIRPHIVFFVNGVKAKELSHPLSEGDELQIVAALSGG